MFYISPKQNKFHNRQDTLYQRFIHSILWDKFVHKYDSVCIVFKPRTTLCDNTKEWDKILSQWA